MTVVGLAAIFYYGIRVHTTGFGSYRHLLPLLVIRSAVANGIAILGILMWVTKRVSRKGQPQPATA
jgi:hypothetical protein